ncbi:MAG TPA: cupin domain-containing protein [Polyangia bacterium]|jgi:quercetin dioxygenase-like cupin family protein
MGDTVSYVGPGQHQKFQPQQGVTLYLLHGTSAYQAFLLEVEPHTDYRSSPHEGEELRYVLRGEVVFTVGDRDYTVPAGGTLRHPSNVAHGFRTGPGPATFVTFALSRNYDVAQLFRGSTAAARE